MRVNRDEEIAGLPGVLVRDFLKRVGNEFPYRRAEHIVGAKLGQPPQITRKLLEDLQSLGYIAPLEGETDAWYITSPGLTVANARASSITRAKAEELMAGFMKRVHVVNDPSCELAYMVAKVAVFGSFLGDCARLGDIDLAVDLAPRFADEKAQNEIHRARMELARQSGRSFRNTLDEMGWPLSEVMQFLKAGSRSFGGIHPTGVLERLGCPYRVLYPPEA